MAKQTALQAQDRYAVKVTVDDKYLALEEVMSVYYGRSEKVQAFLEELSHPFKNWQFIVTEARGMSLDYFHLLPNHPQGSQAARIYCDIFMDAVESAPDTHVKSEAADNLLLFLQKAVNEAESRLPGFMPVILGSFSRITRLDDGLFTLFVRSYYSIDRLSALVLDKSAGFFSDCQPVIDLLHRYFRHSYADWKSEVDPLEWLKKETKEIKGAPDIDSIFQGICHSDIEALEKKLESIVSQQDQTEYHTADESPDRIKARQLLELEGHRRFVERYRDIPQKLYETGEPVGKGNHLKVIFLFHIMNISGLSLIHEDALRDINRTLNILISRENLTNVEKIVKKTFSILKTRMDQFPVTALNCVSNMGKGVIRTDESELINLFIISLIDLGFHSPEIKGVGDDWQIIVNTAHVQNMRTWMELIRLSPKWSLRLISYLIIHLSLCGVYIKDTDLFPRDITNLLNSDIGPVYNQIKQLTKLFPVYFNDIGAEGRLREVSTEIDEVGHRKDPLVHFLRKQTHVESSNRVLLFMKAVLDFWRTRDRSLLESYLPPHIYTEIQERGPYVDGIHRAMTHLEKQGFELPENLLTVSENRLKQQLEKIPDLDDEDGQKIRLGAELYKLLDKKYNLAGYSKIGDPDSTGFDGLKLDEFPSCEKLRDALRKISDPAIDIKRKILKLLEYLEILKKIILSGETYEVREDIYKKRHFTVDIPSMYGSYNEMKFNALGLTFRIESILNVLFDELIENIDLSLITKATIYEIYSRLRLFNKALQLDGIASNEIENEIDLLALSVEVKGFTITQYLDIFKGFAKAVKNIINDYFHNVHEENLVRVLSQISEEELLSKFKPGKEIEDHENMVHQVSEIFFREKIALTPALQQIDRFIGKVLNTLFQQHDRLPAEQLRQLLLYSPENAMTYIDKASLNIVDLGNKGINLVRLNRFHLPVPPGFIITTEVFRCRNVIASYLPAKQQFREQVKTHIRRMEKITGKSFSDPKNPLLFSVRSGSSISQPGMMDTFLNVGINEDIAEGIAAKTGNVWFAWDCYRRFLQCYGMSHGIERDDFDAIIRDFKDRLGVAYKRHFPPEEMKNAALTYKKLIRDRGYPIIEDPFVQLNETITKVLNSWESEKAETYRKIMGISNDWGTAVTVQTMVFGNLSPNSGTGVIFTHNPRWSGDTLRLWGDFTIGNQGEDVVSGLVNTLPISIFQQDKEMRNTDITLESHYPLIYQSLKEWAGHLIFEKGWSPQEMEFTFESPSPADLYLLQTRDMAMRKRQRVRTFDPVGVKNSQRLGHGIGVSEGAMSGRVVFTLEEINRWRSAEPDTSLILVRGDTVPDDIREIYAADGLLTGRGGLTSHAAVVAHRLGRTCIVGCTDLVINEKERKFSFNGVQFYTGDYISIDGKEGSVYDGLIEIDEG